MKYITTIDGHEFVIEVVDDNHVIVDGKMFAVDFDAAGNQTVYSLLVDGHSYEAYVYPNEDAWQVLMRGRLYPARVEDERERRLRSATRGGASERDEFHLKAPMPGLVVAVPVAEGQAVKKGDVLLILESMKMQNELKSPKDGIVMRVKVKPGDSVEQRQVMLSVV